MMGKAKIAMLFQPRCCRTETSRREVRKSETSHSEVRKADTSHCEVR